MRKNMVLGLMILLGVVCLLYVGVKIDMWRLGYVLEDLEVQRAALKKEQGRLQVQLSKLTNPKRIAKKATTELGLIVPNEGQVVMVSLDDGPSQERNERSPLQLVQGFSKTGQSFP